MDDTAVVKLNIKKSSITCKLCNQIWTNKQPRILSCFHTFCSDCLDKHASNNGIFPGDVLLCPSCSNPVPWPAEGADGLQSNLFFDNNEADDAIDAVEAVEDTLCVEHGKDLTLLCISCKVVQICTSCTLLHPGHLLLDPEDFHKTRKTLIAEQENLLTGLKRALHDQKSVLLGQLEKRANEAQELIFKEQMNIRKKIEESFAQRENILTRLNDLVESLNTNLLNFDYLGMKNDIEDFNQKFMKECTKPSCYYDNSVSVSLGKVRSTFKLNELSPFASIKLDSDQIEGICINDDVLHITSWISKDPPKSAILRFSTSNFQPLMPEIFLENTLATGICVFNGNLYCGDWSNSKILLCSNGEAIPFATALQPFGLAAWSGGLLVAAGDGVHMLNADGQLMWSNRLPCPFKWERPCGLATNNQFVYVTDLHGHCVHKLDISNGSCILSINRKGSKYGDLHHPAGIILAPSIGYILANMQNERLDMIDETGNFIESFPLQFKPVWITNDDSMKFLFVTTYINQKRKAVVVLRKD